jgi:hypothetical protein
MPVHGQARSFVRGPVRLLALALALLVPGVGAAEDAWEETRKRLIDPLNSMLHAHWPREIQAKNLDVLKRFYATETGTGLTWEGVESVSAPAAEPTLRWQGARGEESILERYQKLVALFGDIHRAELRIGRVDWRNPTPLGYPTTVHVVVRGRGPEGRLIQLEQWATLHVRFFDPFWEITAEEVTARTLVTLDAPRFTLANEAAAIDSLHANQASPPFRLFGRTNDNPVRQASGVAVGDADGDGCEDVVMAGSPELVLYRSRCDGSYEDATTRFGLPRPYPAAASGVVFLDYDNDGWSDLFIAAVKGGDRLYHNEGRGEDGEVRFVDVSAQAGIPLAVWGGMPTVADYDRDGFLDLYIARMGDHENLSPRPPWNAKNGVRGTLLHNRGDGRFEDVSKHAGVDSPGWDMAAAWADYDGDGWPDLYVANEFGENRLFRNEQDGTFSDRTKEAGVADGGSAMGVAWGDYDGDGDLDLFVSGMRSNSGWAVMHPEFPLPIPWYFRLIGQFTDAVEIRRDEIVNELSRGSTLLRNNGDGTFTDISDSAGVRDGQWGWAAEFLDYDNDGQLDLYAVNGFLTGPIEDDL